MATDDELEYRPCLATLSERLGHRFGDPLLLRRALTHRSHANESGEDDRHNERLEFLGDAVVGLSVGAYLMESRPEAREGELTKLRAMVVSAPGLSRAARNLGVGECLLLGRGEEQGGGRDKDSILSDAFEALIGAVFLDAGFEAAQRVTRAQLAELVHAAERGDLDRDFKTRLQERLAAEGLQAPPRYAVVNERGPDHAKVFEVAVHLEDDELARAEGHSKKQAEQRAARSALCTLLDDPQASAQAEEEEGSESEENDGPV
jgi:ribonuclease-3